MIVKETRKVAEIRQVLCREDIYNSLSDDECPSMDDYMPTQYAWYIGGYVDDEIIALMVYHITDKGLKIHIHVLPECRREHARQFARMALKFGEAKNAIIYTEIPTCYKSVRNFALKFGFELDGTIKDDFTKNGVVYDVDILRLNNAKDTQR